jgi:hypothetical protein
MLHNKFFLFIGLLFLLLSTSSYSQTLKLYIPIVEDSPQQHLFYHELLKTAMIEAGHIPELIVKKYPQKRIKKLLENGELSIYWMIESAPRNKKYIPIKVGLTNGLIGKRILFIKQGDQAKYDQVKTLDDFRNLNLIGGMGKNWFDANVWKINHLQYQENEGNWKSIFKMIPRNRTYNYFSRGINEIVTESLQYPALDIEKKLVFIYEQDFQFYLSKEGTHAGKVYQTLLREALQKAKESGLIARLVQKYWGNDFQILNYDQRIKIYLRSQT